MGDFLDSLQPTPTGPCKMARLVDRLNDPDLTKDVREALTSGLHGPVILSRQLKAFGVDVSSFAPYRCMKEDCPCGWVRDG